MGKKLKSLLIILAIALCFNIRTSNAGFFFKKLKERTPPLQPATGPGGAEYKYQEASSEHYEIGTDYEYWLFKPALPSRVKEIFPVIVFNHGWEARNPKFYQAWIDHLVKKGNIIIYPQYQESLVSSSANFTPNAIGAFKLALKKLASDKQIRANLSNLAFLGHSEGGIVSANMAALAKEENLPQPKAIMCVQPAASWINTPLEDLSKIPKGTLLLTIASDKDNIAMEIDAKKIFQEAVNINPEDKNFILMASDDSGIPQLIADHFSPCGIFETMRDKVWSNVDALDYYGFWKLFDGLRDAAFFQRNRKYALGNTSEQKFMGEWSDGSKVKELIVITDKEDLTKENKFSEKTRENSQSPEKTKFNIFSRVKNFIKR